MFAAVIFLAVVSSALAACPDKPAMQGAYVCSWGSYGTSQWAKYCCLSGAAPIGDTKITCKGTSWTKPVGNCGTNACGAELAATAPFYVPKRGSQCTATVTGPATRCLGDKCSALYGASINEVLGRHNCWRSRVSPPAKRSLAKLQWDEQLAVIAERWAAQCPNGHDAYDDRALPNRNTNGVSWKYVGQNICYASYNQTWSACIDAWAGEQKDFVYGVGPATAGAVTGHYTQVVAERSFFVGCGTAYCPNSQWTFVKVCNYGPAGNFNGGEKVPYIRA